MVCVDIFDTILGHACSYSSRAQPRPLSAVAPNHSSFLAKPVVMANFFAVVRYAITPADVHGDSHRKNLIFVQDNGFAESHRAQCLRKLLHIHRKLIDVLTNDFGRALAVPSFDRGAHLGRFSGKPSLKVSKNTLPRWLTPATGSSNAIIHARTRSSFFSTPYSLPRPMFFLLALPNKKLCFPYYRGDDWFSQLEFCRSLHTGLSSTSNTVLCNSISGDSGIFFRNRPRFWSIQTIIRTILWPISNLF